MPYQRNSLLNSFVAAFVAALLAASLCPAQTAPQTAPPASKRVQGAAPRSSARKPPARARKRPARPQMAQVVKTQLPEFISGDKIITATATTNTTINIGLAKYGVCIIEYPEKDSIYMVHPGDESMVTVDRTGKKPHDPLVIRPGKNFVVPEKDNLDPTTIVTVQMGSGLPFSFRIFPVKSINQNANRVVLSYDRDDVVRARINAGLAVNYKPVPPPSYQPVEVAGAQPSPVAAPTPQAQAASLPVAAPPVSYVPAVETRPAPTPTPVAVESSGRELPLRPAVLTSAGASSPPPAPAVSPAPTPSPTPSLVATPTGASQSAPAPLVALLRDKMKQAVASPKSFSTYSKSSHGLSVAVTLPAQVDAQSEYVIIAVRNTLSAPVRLLEGQPELSIETLDRRKRPILTAAPVEIRHVETTLPGSRTLAPGATAYFTVAYTSPVLDANQYLRVSVGQTMAADEPSVIDLSVKSR